MCIKIGFYARFFHGFMRTIFTRSGWHSSLAYAREGERRFTLYAVERAQVEHSWARLKIQLLKMYKLLLFCTQVRNVRG